MIATPTEPAANLKAAIKREDRSLASLARRTTYTANYIGRVANGRQKGTARFHKEMEVELGPYWHDYNRPPVEV